MWLVLSIFFLLDRHQSSGRVPVGSSRADHSGAPEAAADLQEQSAVVGGVGRRRGARFADADARSGRGQRRRRNGQPVAHQNVVDRRPPLRSRHPRHPPPPPGAARHAAVATLFAGVGRRHGRRRRLRLALGRHQVVRRQFRVRRSAAAARQRATAAVTHRGNRIRWNFFATRRPRKVLSIFRCTVFSRFFLE